jgi:phospholipid/cholesterol/gamma-HCH transport system substrate-binding protein
MATKVSARAGQLITLTLFTALCVVVFSYLWVNSGGKLPGVTKQQYQATAYFPRVANLVYFADVMVAGVKIGKVQEVSPAGREAKVVMALDSNFPLHQGVTAQVRAKSLVEESFIELNDGTGPALPSGTVLPRDAAHPETNLNDLLVSLSGQTREQLAHTLRSLGGGTQGTQQSISDAVQGLGALGRGGYTTLDALNAQTDSLKKVTGHTATMLAALNTQRGQIAQLTEDANRLFTATADGKADLEETLRTLPPVLTSARNASSHLTDLGHALHPVARNLRDASGDLNGALDQLPDVGSDLRHLVPDLDDALHKAPDTLHRVPDASRDVIHLIPHGEDALGGLNPILGYLKPYALDIGSMLPQFADSLAHGDANGNSFNAYLQLGPNNVRGLPVSIAPFAGINPYMKPGGTVHLNNNTRPFTRLHKDSPGR